LFYSCAARQQARLPLFVWRRRRKRRSKRRRKNKKRSKVEAKEKAKERKKKGKHQEPGGDTPSASVKVPPPPNPLAAPPNQAAPIPRDRNVVVRRPQAIQLNVDRRQATAAIVINRPVEQQPANVVPLGGAKTVVKSRPAGQQPGKQGRPVVIRVDPPPRPGNPVGTPT
jgi:hypothetical protein